MSKVGLFVRLEAKPGKEKEIAEFLKGALPLAEGEPHTVSWYAIQLGPSTFAIFDTFNDDSGRQEHLNGKIAAALMEKAPDLFVSPPAIEKASILAEKQFTK
jgi:quinol monooxygenase YgiN